MRHPLLAAAALTAALSLSACLTATDTAEREEMSTIEGVVRSIDRPKRRFVIEGPERTIQYRAGPEVRNFDEMQVGDRVMLTYYDLVAVSMAAPEDNGERQVEEFGERAPKGSRPGALGGTVETMVVTLVSYNPNNHTARIRLPEGEEREVAVQEEFRAFAASRKPGDRVLVLMQEAFAVSVIPSE